MKITAIVCLSLGLFSLTLSGCVSKANSHEHSPEESHSAKHGEVEHAHKIVVTSPLKQDLVNTVPYVCQIRSCKHIEIKALEGGYLQDIQVKEGQAVKKGELMFQIIQTLYQARLDSEIAEANRIEIELTNAQSLKTKGIVSAQEIAIKKAELAKAQAKVSLAKAELGFASITAPFDGIVDRQRNQLGSLIAEGDVLTTLSDNSLMWVYFNVQEKRYLEYKAALSKEQGNSDNLKIELKLADGHIFPHAGKIGAIEADFNNVTGNIAFRADFENPDGLLRNGQTGTILMRTRLKDALVIPQRATFEILDKRYAFVIDEDNVVHQRDITIASVQDDVFVIQEGLTESDKLIFEGIRQVRDGDKIEFEYREPADVLGHLKYHAE